MALMKYIFLILLLTSFYCGKAQLDTMNLSITKKGINQNYELQYSPDNVSWSRYLSFQMKDSTHDYIFKSSTGYYRVWVVGTKEVSKTASVYKVLPIGITNVKVSGNTLHWTSENEIGKEPYEIQRSYDGANFTTIERVLPTGSINYKYNIK